MSGQGVVDTQTTPKQKNVDEFYMRRALKLAKKGEGYVSPNPMVGAVIVEGNRIIGEGYHQRYGGLHAEIDAIRNASEKVAGSTIYITLEPCSHHGKTPPCVETLIAHKPKRVVIGTFDPNPVVSGRGIKTLKNHGMETTTGILADDCKKLNEKFFKFIQTRIPFITLKFAQSLDGRIALNTGDSKWVSSPGSLRVAHRLRSTHDAILVGAGTVLHDNPELTVRLVRGKNPIRIVVDSQLRISMDARVLKNQDAAKTMLASTLRADLHKRNQLAKMNIDVLLIDETPEHQVDLNKLFVELGRRGVSSVLVEGGAEIITSLLKERTADRLIVTIAPKIFGKGIEAVGDLGIGNMDGIIRLTDRKFFKKGDDFILEGKIEK
jgi:diaminohydroxyphosphoribosylaminopyrimidine deaminase/5-amino-6-(5-phosphoribosylamino)uracil reductase